MDEKTLLSIKERIGKFHKVINPIANHWNIPHYITISVILQNMSHNSEGTVNYNFQKEVQKLYELKKILQSFSEYYNSHFENWVSGEIDCIIMGETYHED